MNAPKLSIIIPCYNEEKTVGEVVKRLLAVPFKEWTAEIIVVDDGSTDGTHSVLANLPQEVRVITLRKNMGKGGAVKEGIAAATGEWAIIQDADLECLPEEIPSLLQPLKNILPNQKVAVMGSRELGRRKQKSEFFSRL